MTKIERAIAALRECAEAVDELDASLRRTNPLFKKLTMVNTQALRDEADWLEGINTGLEDSNDTTDNNTP